MTEHTAPHHFAPLHHFTASEELTEMNTLAYDGPGPWILFLPLVWAAVVVTVVTALRRTVWRGGRGPRGPWAVPRGPQGPYGAQGENAPIAILGRRFATGEIDEDEYWRRLSVLDEQFGRPFPAEKGSAG